VIGVPASLATTRLISTMLFGVSASDPLTVTAAALMIAITLLAGYLPSQRVAATIASWPDRIEHLPGRKLANSRVRPLAAPSLQGRVAVAENILQRELHDPRIVGPRIRPRFESVRLERGFVKDRGARADVPVSGFGIPRSTASFAKRGGRFLVLTEFLTLYVIRTTYKS